MNRSEFPRLTWAATTASIMALALIVSPTGAAKRNEAVQRVSMIRVPNGGIQPQIAIDDKGVLHMLYFSGDAAHGDLYYVRSGDGGTTFSVPIKVNSHPGSAIATGNIRGAHVAVGRHGRVYVAWNGTYELDRPETGQPGMKHPMLFARLNNDGTGFEPERNLIRAAYGLDGGGAIAADNAGDVYVFWHAPAPGTEGEGNRRIWVARSTDDGETFAAEKPASEQPTGACGCCGMSAFADRRDNVYALYRSATEIVHRDIYLLNSTDRGETFRGTDISEWNIGACTMSMENLSESPAGILAAWETMGNVYYGIINPSTGRMSAPIAAPGEAKGRKYPSVAGNSRGETLLAWAEGTKWGKGGSVAWQVFDKNGEPEGAAGRADGVPPWSLVAAFARPDGGFTLVY
ncbi:MAG TPA: sialidase family protein [Bryobacteraceae bacterium]|nr:sialidase family protein [Bryobacteraceae bacterium]